MSSEAITNNLLIEGFDPSKLEKIEESSHDKGWKEIYGAYQNKTVLQATMVAIDELQIGTDEKETCAIVQVEDIRGFIPIREFGVDNKKQLRAFSGTKVAFKVLSYDRENSVFIASRNQALEHMASIFFNRNINEGDIIPAVVRNVSPNLVRADIGGIEVKIPIEDIRYGWIDDLTAEVKKGDHFYVKVLEMDKENKKVKVSKKALQKNPFPDCLQRYRVGSEHTGTVSGVAEYGIFVNLEDGVDSLASHLKYENVKKGDQVLVRILNANTQKEQIITKIVRVL